MAKTLYGEHEYAHVQTLNVDYAMEILYNEGVFFHWFKRQYETMEEFKEKDPIGYGEFGGIVERILLASVQEKG